MISISLNDDLDYQRIPYDNQWEEGDYKGLLMHSVHAYPAKFPPFIANQAFNYAMKEGVNVLSSADIFCGCGTTALEAKKRNISFWGCDINPVATMITSAKIADYDVDSLKKYYREIVDTYSKAEPTVSPYINAPDRLKYWYTETQYNELLALLEAINITIPLSDLVSRNGYYCIFSSILKKCSKWLQKSIKPQVDPNKKALNVLDTFTSHCKAFIKAVEQISDGAYARNNPLEIELANFLEIQPNRMVDLIVTSPPYVTSYEYADLHQLSSLWLGYASDYKTLRTGTIGSCYNYKEYEINKMPLNNTAKDIVRQLAEVNCPDSKVLPIARYYSEMQIAVKKCFDLLNPNGMALFVIGDSELKKVKLLNSTHLIEEMQNVGFTDLKIGKRTVSKGICVPYRDIKGRFTKSGNEKSQIYHEEYIISGRKSYL